MTDIVYGIRITGDAGDAKKAFEETKRAQEGLNEAQRGSGRTAAEMERANERNLTSLNRMRLGALAAAAAMVAMIRSMTSYAVEAERSIARMNAVWTATGGTSGLSRAQLEGLTERMARETRFDDESIRDAIAVLSTFRQVSGEAFTGAMTMAAGLAEVMRTDLQSAVVMLGRVFEDPINNLGALRRAGIQFMDSQEEVIKKLVETGRTAEVHKLILQELKSKGFDAAAAAMNQGLSRALSDTGKEWGELLEALQRTKAVQGPVTDSLGAIRNSLWAIRNVIEGGSWMDSLKEIVLIDKPSARGKAVDPNSAEAIAARRAASDASWQAAFDRQQAQAKDFLKKLDEQAAKDLASGAGLEFTSQLAANLAQAVEEMTALSPETLEKLKERRDALLKEGEAVRDLVNPWNAYAREVERFRKLMELGVITQREFGEAVALEARKVGGAVEDMAGKGRESFDELKQAIEGWGQDLSRELARGEVGLRSFARLFEEILAMQLHKRAIQPLLQLGSGFIDSLFTPGPGGGLEAGYTGYTGHSGGIVGRGGIEGNPARYVHPAYFERAPRLHSGGLAGDEVPAILRRGEGVFTREQMRAMGAGNLTVKVINETGVPVQGQASAPRFDASGAVVDLVLRRLAVDGTARQQLAGQLSRPQH